MNVWDSRVIEYDDVRIISSWNGDNRKIEVYDNGALVFEASACPCTEEDLICFYQKLK